MKEYSLDDPETTDCSPDEVKQLCGLRPAKAFENAETAQTKEKNLRNRADN